MTLNYDTINPQDYDSRNTRSARERYLTIHWCGLIQQQIEKYCKNKNVLEIGCGTGKYSNLIKTHAQSLFSIDISKRMIEYAKKTYPAIDFGIANVNSLPVQKGSCDVIVCIGLLEFVDRSILFQNIAKILTDDGHCIIQSSNRNRLMRLIPLAICRIINKKYTEYPYLEPSRNEILKNLNENNFIIISESMNDGLIWLPDCIDKKIGLQIYNIIEFFVKIIKFNPFSNGMLFIIKKKN